MLFGSRRRFTSADVASPNNFIDQILLASEIGQNEVNALVRPTMEEGHPLRYEFLSNVGRFSFVKEIRESVFTAPSLHQDFVEAVLYNLVKKTEVGFNKYNVDDFLSLVKHPDCDARLFAKVIDFICLSKVSVAARLIEELAHQGSLPVEWLIGVYSECWGHGFDMTIWFDFKYSSREMTSVKQYVFSLICEHYEDMPESWVSHMLEDFRYKAQARIQARLISSPFTQR